MCWVSGLIVAMMMTTVLVRMLMKWRDDGDGDDDADVDDEKRPDGKTPYQRHKGRKCEPEVVPFGEKVSYRMLEVAKDRHQALEERWAKGFRPGNARHSPEILIATEDGTVKSWPIRRLPDGQQWDAEMVGKVKGSPPTGD